MRVSDEGCECGNIYIYIYIHIYIYIIWGCSKIKVSFWGSL